MDTNEPLHQDESEFAFRVCALQGEDVEGYSQMALHTFFPNGVAIASVEECEVCGVAHEETWDYRPDEY